MPKHQRIQPATKTELIRRALCRKSGASLADLSATTGWQAHSLRAALSRFRKAGYVVERRVTKKVGAAPVYKIISSPDAS